MVVTGQVNGTSDPDRMFSGDQIDMRVSVEFPRIAGHAAYGEPYGEATSSVNDDWVESILNSNSAPPA